jgi:hypothetical protein
METKRIRLTDDLIKGVSYTAKMEGVGEAPNRSSAAGYNDKIKGLIFNVNKFDIYEL